MKNMIKVVTVVILAVTISFFMPGFLNSTGDTKAQEDTFTIVEIVPYKGMGEIGYYIGGQEPIDKTLLSVSTAKDDLAFLSDAISVYPSYEEKQLTKAGQADTGWYLAGTYTVKNGYFRKKVKNESGFYRKTTTRERYDLVADGDGSYKAVIDGEGLDKVYTVSNPVNRKNVNAFFIHNSVTGTELFNNRVGYEPCSVKLKSSGDYDYDYNMDRFLLNKGKGSYEVLFERTTNGSYYLANDYEIVEDNSGNYSCAVDYDYVGSKKGNYVKINSGTIFIYDKRYGDYIFVQDNTALGYSNYFSDGSKTWVNGFGVYEEYQYTNHVELLNKELFKRYSLNAPEASLKDYPIQVITLTPEELSTTIIEEADYFYINANYYQNPGYIMLYENYNPVGKAIPSKDKYANNQTKIKQNLNFALHDISWDYVQQIMLRAAGTEDNKAAVVFDSTFYQEAVSKINSTILNPYDFLKAQITNTGSESNIASMCNMAKLYIMLNQQDTESFYQTYLASSAMNKINKVATAINRTGATGSFIQPGSTNSSPIDTAAIYWNGNTFPSTGVNTGDLTENGTEGSNYRDYKRILNIEPTADFTASEAAIRTMLSDYNVQIVNMTSIQFNGSLEDINTRYDMIYMGDGAGRFNTWGSYTNFNDLFLDSYYYFKEGDFVFDKDYDYEDWDFIYDSLYYFKDWDFIFNLLYNLLNWDFLVNTDNLHRYRGNDISAQKKRELENYLSAGYPIVLDDDLHDLPYYTGVKSNTNMYSFIYQSKRNSSYSNFLNAASYQYDKQNFLKYLKKGFDVARPMLRLHQPKDDSDPTKKYITVDPSTERLTLEFELVSKKVIPNNYLYDAVLYLDGNADGIFDAAEAAVPIPDGGPSLTGIRESNIKTYTKQYDLSGLNGAAQWKLIVKRQDKPAVRSELTGLIQNNHNESIYILHINENESAYSLKEKQNDGLSLFYLYAGKNKLTDYNLVIETMTVQKFEQLYSKEPYTSENADTTNKLSAYHLLIFDNPNTAISPANGAIKNIKDEIAKKLGVIYTKNALGCKKQNDFNEYNGSLSDKHTYNRINRDAPTTIFWGHWPQLYIYKNLNSNGELNIDTTYLTTYLTKTNEGAITRYPYQINQAIKIAANSYSNYAAVDYDLQQNRRLVGWYTLSDSKSPVVRQAGFVNGGNTSDLYQGMYSSSPNDVKNNYYLFSNGWCFYSGIQFALADKPDNDHEMQLFVNTIIAAYKACNRVVSKKPVINITDPKPDENNTITITRQDIIGTDFILTFELSESSSNMDLSILLDDNPDGSWKEELYQVTGGILASDPISVNNVDKGIYALKIPINELTVESLLKITAVNMQGDEASAEVKLKYLKEPVVTITKPIPIPNDSNQFLYVDFDYNEVDSSDLNASERFRIEFKIEQALTNVRLQITSEGTDLAHDFPDNVLIRRMNEDGSESDIDPTQYIPDGKFVMYIPLKKLEGYSSREITIMATDLSDSSGETSVTLLRRSLFPLD